MNSTPRSQAIEALINPNVSGLILLGDEIHRVSVLSELLFMDARSWFMTVEEGLLVESHRHLDAGEEDSATRLAELAFEIATMVESDSPAPMGGAIWPQLANRSQLRVWDVNAPSEVGSYLRSLLEFSTTDRDDDWHPAFILDFSHGRSHFYHTDRLSKHVEFCGEGVSCHKMDAAGMKSLCDRLIDHPMLVNAPTSFGGRRLSAA